jgi:hypothetical protein
MCDVHGVGVILNVNNEKQRSARISKGIQRNQDDYHKGIVGGAVQAQSMTTVIEGMQLNAHKEVDGGTYEGTVYVKGVDKRQLQVLQGRTK